MTGSSVSDAFLQFARAHLLTAADRAVYPVLAADRARAWTAGEVAAQAGVSHHEADQALRRFAAAGIVTHSRSPGAPHRYQWTAAMAYLFGLETTVQFVDPVCGMPVPEDSPHVVHDGDRDVRFCSLPCLVRWRSGAAGR